MTTKTYKGYTIKIVGLSHYIYRPTSKFTGNEGSHPVTYRLMSDGYAQSMAAAKRWVSQDMNGGVK